MNNMIQYPLVDFKLTKERFDKFTQNFNAGKPLSKQLRPMHYELFYGLIRLYMKTIRDNNDKFSRNPSLRAVDRENPPALFTNNVQLSHMMHNSSDSVYRYLLRLKAAGVIIKKNHGAKRDYEVLINPRILVFRDFLQLSEKQVSFSVDPASCGLSQNKQETFNNIIMPVNNVGNTSVAGMMETLAGNLKKGINASVDGTYRKLFTGNTEKNAEISDSAGSFSEQHHKKIKRSTEKLQEMKRTFSLILLSLSLKLLWKDREINEAQKEKALQYLENNYFEHCRYETDFSRTMAEFTWRIEAAGRNISRKGYGPSWFVFPLHYFDLNNSTGFRGTKKWYISHRAFTKLKAEKRKRKSDLDKLTQQIMTFMLAKDVATYNRCENYVKNNIPHLLPLYQSSVIENRIYYPYE